MKQSDYIKRMDMQELRKQMFISQFFLMVLTFVGSFLLFDSFLDQWQQLFHWNSQDIIFYGILPGLIIVTINLLLTYTLPATYYDDDGINEKLFSNQPIWFIISISFLVAVAEEMLFRGVIQSTFGYWVASILFALIHFRYLKKPLLLVSILLVSFYLGYLFHITNNLAVTITAHFVVDALLGFFIRFKREVWVR
ncbi:MULTISPECIES: CPBP family intramembrane glutamic endopeptidase [Clostridia]|uniref:CPBP family intramembrane glutamic endopeptidase n=1 Tax=Clostridia TaxID=186801 RepID=UPI000EA15CED|nr:MULTISPECIES: CPBP family intramembrane glutamic endopeptidase [Clostridia]NBJ70465.1 CPBP family intramembrane metalloprotease [Roseburia sp. 1XD42-34]RKI76120.1 CPBP family intramembrane metalloprotease [Clostridium sp. 1xD42-85]